MPDNRTGLAALLFCLAGLLFNWPLVSLFLEKPLYAAWTGLFAAMAGLVLALALVAHAPAGRKGPPEASPDADDADDAGESGGGEPDDDSANGRDG